MAAQTTAPLLTIENLSVAFDTPDGTVEAVNDLSLTVQPGEILGIVGESGSGKSQTWMAPLGLLADNARVSGHIWFEGEDLLTMPIRALNRVRGRRISMVFQDPMSSLNPYLKVGQQLMEALRVHNPYLTRTEARAQCIQMLDQVAIPDATTRFGQHPHELSGGMRQRVMIAMALLNKPDILIADEPTTALDVTIQAEILDILLDLQQRLGMAIVFITHDLGLIANICDRMAVMYAGQLMELGRVDQALDQSRHPYTLSLLNAMPRFEGERPDRLTHIPGLPPDLKNLPVGCAFYDRCFCNEAACFEARPALFEAADGHLYRCRKQASHGELKKLMEAGV